MGKLGNDFRQALRVATHQKSVTVMAIVACAARRRHHGVADRVRERREPPPGVRVCAPP